MTPPTAHAHVRDAGAAQDDIEVVRLTPAKQRRAIDAVLKELSLTREQIREQARTGQFSSIRARQLWMATGGSI